MRALVVVLVVMGCARGPRSPAPATPETPQPDASQSASDSTATAATTSTSTSTARSTTSDSKPLEPEPRPVVMYALEEALADVLSGPLTHVGTGPWFGIHRISACVYRNQRVLVVNVYCTKKEMNVFSIVVLSPTKGRAVIYAEANKPISALKRPGYFTFKAETQPTLPEKELRPVSLEVGYAELTKWDEQRYRKFPAGCFGGVELRQKQEGGCSRTLEAHVSAWKQRNQGFLDNPPEDWYRIVRDLRARAKQDGKHVANPGG